MVKVILKKWDCMMWSGLIWLRMDKKAGFFLNTVMNLRFP
jgi:hypothetical protein